MVSDDKQSIAIKVGIMTAGRQAWHCVGAESSCLENTSRRQKELTRKVLKPQSPSPVTLT